VDCSTAGSPPAPDRTAEPAATGYRVIGPRTFADRNAVARTGAAIDFSEHGVLHVSATRAEAAAITRLGFRLEAAVDNITITAT
jgi:carboxypeptidase T